MGLNDDVHVTPEMLCRRIKASDRAAFEKVFRRHRNEMLRYIRGIVRREAVAHDLVQDVFADLWSSREMLDPSRSLKAYLYGMARNRALRHLRDTRTHIRKHALLQHESDAHASDGSEREHEFDAGLLGDMLRQWIAELPNRQREALVLSRYHDLSHREIASVMGVSPRTVNNHIMRALNHLNDRVRTFEPALLK